MHDPAGRRLIVHDKAANRVVLLQHSQNGKFAEERERQAVARAHVARAPVRTPGVKPALE
jgi:hypothetical protein